MTAPPGALSANQRAAETVCRHAHNVDDARLLLEMLGLVDEGGHELLPDSVEVITKEMLDLADPGPPRVVQEPPMKRSTLPEGLRNLPPGPLAAPEPARRRRSLTEELDELELTDPNVAAAAASYDAMVEKVTGRTLPPRPTLPEETPAMPTQAQHQTRALLQSVAPPRPKPVAPPVALRANVEVPDIRPGSSAAAGPYIDALSVVELFVDPAYQRPLDELRVRKMVAAWQPRMVGILDVSDRGPGSSPRYAIVNGQHRWAAAGRAGVQYVACNVHEGLTPEGEAALMYELDRGTKKLTGFDQWRARRGAGDPTVLEVEQVCASHGLRVDPAPSDGTMRAYGSAEKLLKPGGSQLLDAALTVLHGAYGASHLAYQAPLLMGVGQLLQRHGADVDAERLIRALAATRPEQLRSHATALREIEGGPLHELMTRAIATAYNRTQGPRLSGKAS